MLPVRQATDASASFQRALHTLVKCPFAVHCSMKDSGPSISSFTVHDARCNMCKYFKLGDDHIFIHNYI